MMMILPFLTRVLGTVPAIISRQRARFIRTDRPNTVRRVYERVEFRYSTVQHDRHGSWLGRWSRAAGRPDGRRDLDRFGHSGLSRPSGRMDAEPGSGKARHPPELPGGSRCEPALLAEPSRVAGLAGETERGPPRPRRARAARS